ncbi:lanthionine synthetase LanC family protein [Streptomyces sp. NPDC018019]|uniref:lanthionine synthetase LanC family protein n=1 Tax=Streptomyces sp. NPDC018019 TaxID=3365030 RepID=UPI00379005C7
MPLFENGQWMIYEARKENSRSRAKGPARSHWCYGTPGVARALYLAGTALDHNAWRDTAVTALQHTLAQSRPHPQPPDGLGLCHGLANLLHTTTRLAHDSHDPLLARHLPALADGLLAALTRLPHPPVLQEHPGRQNPPSYPAGLLNGASGIALALHSHATGQPPLSSSRSHCGTAKKITGAVTVWSDIMRLSPAIRPWFLAQAADTLPRHLHQRLAASYGNRRGMPAGYVRRVTAHIHARAAQNGLPTRQDCLRAHPPHRPPQQLSLV